MEKIKKILKKFLKLLFQGTVIIAPLFFTLFAIIWLFNLIDDIIPNIIEKTAKLFDPEYKIKYIPGVGFLATIFVLAFIGYISRIISLKRVVKYFEKKIEKIPGINYVYSTFRDISQSIAGGNKKFTKAILFYENDKKILRTGFVTNENLKEWGMKDFVSVYVPMSFSIAGNVYLVHKSRVQFIDHPTSGEVMKFIISGGVTTKKKVENSVSENKHLVE